MNSPITATIWINRQKLEQEALKCEGAAGATRIPKRDIAIILKSIGAENEIEFNVDPTTYYRKLTITTHDGVSVERYNEIFSHLNKCLVKRRWWQFL